LPGISQIDSGLLSVLVVTCVVTVITPGPNNFMVLSARLIDTRHAASRTYLGVCLGFPCMVLTVSTIVYYFGEAFIEQITFYKYAGMSFLLYLAGKLFFAKPTKLQTKSGLAPSFLFMVLFQWANPKAWAMAASTAVIAGPEFFHLPALIYLLAIFPCVGVWFWFGGFLKNRVLGTPVEIHMNRVLGLLLAASVLMMI